MPRDTRFFPLLVVLIFACSASVALSQNHFIPILDEEDAEVEKALGPSGLDGEQALWQGEQSPGASLQEKPALGDTIWNDLRASVDPIASPADSRPPTRSSRDVRAWFFAGKEGLDSTLLGLFASGRYRVDWQEMVGDVQTRGVKQGRYQWNSPYLDAMSDPAGRMPRYKRNATRRYIEVRWGERRYLVADDDLVFIDFCNAINAGDEPRRGRWGRHLLRRGDWSKPAAGRPSLKPCYLAYILRSPLQARILRLKDRNGRSVGSLRGRGRAMLDVGRRDGVKQYHRFFLPGAFAFLVIEKVRQTDAVAQVYPGTRGPWDPRAIKPLTLGSTVTTRRPPPPAIQSFDDGVSSPDDPW